MPNLIKLLIISSLFISLNSFAANFNIFADDKKENTSPESPASSTSLDEADNIPNLKNKSDYQKIIDDYKTYLLSVNPQIRKEIKEYRIGVAKLNEEKRKLYRRLSNEAQAFLKTANEFRRKLPLQDKNKINLNQTTNIKAEQTNQ